MKTFYSPEYVSAAHSFDTTRKARWIADSLDPRPIVGVEVVAPDPLTVEDLLRVHDSDYIEAVRTGTPQEIAESQGFEWDSSLWDMVLASNGGVLAAARAALADGVSGSLSSGLHHARRDRGEGFCTFNGLAIAGKALLADGTADSILILDFDAHCGGGTAELISDEPRIQQFDVSVSPLDWYTDVPNAQLIDIDHARDYLPAIRRQLTAAENSGPFDLCLYNAGMDPYEGCAIGGLDGITADMLAQREQLVFEWCERQGMPVAFVLAGGYIGSRVSESALVNLHRLTVTTAARSQTFAGEAS